MKLNVFGDLVVLLPGSPNMVLHFGTSEISENMVTVLISVSSLLGGSESSDSSVAFVRG